MTKKEPRSLEWATTTELTEELRVRFPGAGVVACEELSKTDDDAYAFEFAWGPLHRVAGLAFGLRTMVEHSYFKVRAINDMEQEIEDESDPEQPE